MLITIIRNIRTNRVSTHKGTEAWCYLPHANKGRLGAAEMAEAVY